MYDDDEVEEEAGAARYGHVDDDEVMVDDAPPARRFPTSQQHTYSRPMSLPEQMGMDPAHLQRMKSSFALSRDQTTTPLSPVHRIYATQQQLDFNEPEFSPAKRPRTSNTTQTPGTFQPRTIPPVVIIPELVPLKTDRFTVDSFVPLKDSVTAKHVGNVKDAGTYMGRSFRVCWGRNGTIVRPGMVVGSVKIDKVQTVLPLPTTKSASNVRLLLF
jgi:hypothetical protein